MRKILMAVLVGGLGGAATVASAVGPWDSAPQASAYLTLNFGGVKAMPRNLHYGLRLDHDRRQTAGLLAPILHLDLNGSGVMMARLNGVNLGKRSLIARQDEAAPATDPSTTPVDGAAPAEAAPVDTGTPSAETTPEAVAAEASAEGTTYSAADWGLIALGAVGVAYAGYEVSKSDDDASASSSGGGDGDGDGGGGGGDVPPLCAPGTIPPPIGGECLPLPVLTRRGGESNDKLSREYQEWLDGGSGQMGDLTPVN